MKRAVIDTNVLIYAYFKDQAMHQEARSLLNRLSEWLIPTIVIHELIWFCRGAGLSRREAVSLIAGFTTSKKSKIVEVTPELLVESLLSGLENWEDNLLLLISEEMRVPLATFDAELRSEALRRGIDVLPRE